MLIAEVAGSQEVSVVLKQWGLDGPRPVLVCVGGAGGLGEEYRETVRAAFRDHLFPVLERCGAVVVDGGTRSGVMRLLGETVGNRPVPLLGVAARGTVRVPGGPGGGTVDLEPHHSGVLLVEGRTWGAESPWIAAVAGLVAGSAPSVTLLVNGGEIAYRDARLSVDAGRPVITVAGSGRTADVISRASIRDDATTDPRAAELNRSGLVRFAAIDDPAALAAQVETLLGGVRS